MSLFPTDVEATLPPLVPIANTDNLDRRADIVFVHGLMGQGQTTWTSENNFYWPKELGKDLSDVGIWVMNYQSSPTTWLGHTMPVEGRSLFLLEALKNKKIGDRRIIFIGHSLGGIMIKQMIHDARDLGVYGYEDIALRTRGVVFLGTPNTGSNLASLYKSFRNVGVSLGSNITDDQLEINAPILVRLNTWYQNHVESMEIKTRAFYETVPTHGTIVVDQSSANPMIPNIRVVGVDENHISICKPTGRDSLVYESVKQFIDEEAIPLPAKYEKNFIEFIDDFNNVRFDTLRLNAFREKHGGQEVLWDGIVMDIKPSKKNPTCSISATSETKVFDRVEAAFQPWNFTDVIKPNVRIRIRGILSKQMSQAGALLNECKVVEPQQRTGANE